MLSLFGRHPVIAIFRTVVGMALVVFGFIGMQSGRPPIDSTAYAALKECANDQIPNDGTCYSAAAGVVTGTSGSTAVTLVDARGTQRTVTLVHPSNFAGYAAGSTIALKYWKDQLVALEIPGAATAASATTTEMNATSDSPLAAATANSKAIGELVVGAIMLLTGGVPLVMALRSVQAAPRGSKVPEWSVPAGHAAFPASGPAPSATSMPTHGPAAAPPAQASTTEPASAPAPAPRVEAPAGGGWSVRETSHGE